MKIMSTTTLSEGFTDDGGIGGKSPGFLNGKPLGLLYNKLNTVHASVKQVTNEAIFFECPPDALVVPITACSWPLDGDCRPFLVGDS